MSLEKIIKKIEKEAEAEASQIIKKAEAEGKQIMDEGRNDTQVLIEKMESDHMKTVEGIRRKNLSAARHEVRHMIMHAKEEVIADCFSKAKDSLNSLEGKKYQDIVAHLITQTKPLMKQGVVVPSRDADKKIAQNLDMEVTDDRITALGGVIVREKDGSMEINNTFDGILERKQDEIRIKISKILFK